MRTWLTSFEWGFHAAGWVLAGLGILLLLLALFADRSRGRRRCPKCWYSMTGVPGLLCPECGRPARSERRLFRTRRRWRWAWSALVIMAVGYAAHSTPTITRGGVPAASPTAVLLLIMESMDWPRPGANEWADELEKRFADRTLGLCEGIAVRLMLRNWLFSYRPDWVCDVPIRVTLEDASWAGLDSAIRARLAGDRPWVRMDHRTLTSRAEWTDGSVELGLLSGGSRRMELEIEVWTAPRRRGDAVKGPRWVGRVNYPIKVEGIAAAKLVPVPSAQLNTLIASSLAADEGGVRDHITLPIARPAGLEDVSIAVRVEYLRGEEVVAIAKVWDNGLFPAWRTPGAAIPLPIRWLPEEEIAAGRIIRVDSMRVVPDLQSAMMDSKRGRYWSGTLSFPWSAQRSPGRDSLRESMYVPNQARRRSR